MKKAIPLLLFSILTASCGPSKEQESSAAAPTEVASGLTIVDKGIKTFPIAEDASFENLNDARVTIIDGKEYFSFSYYHMFDMFLYLYDYETGEILNKMTFVIEGPNAFNASIGFNYFFHTLDSVFVGSLNGDYAIMNSKAEIIHKIKRDESDDYRGDMKFNEASYFDGNLIHTSTYSGYPYRDIDLEYTWATLDIKANTNLQRALPARSFIQNFDEITALRKAATTKAGYQHPLRRYLHRGGDKFYASTPISDTICVFDKNYELINTFYSGIPGVDVTDYEEYLKLKQVKFIKGGIGGEPVLNQPPHFTRSAIDPQGKYLYRVLIEKTKGEYVEKTNQEAPIVAKASLLVVDLTTEKLDTYSLPLDEIDLYEVVDNRPFVSKAGIHFRVKNQENEDQVQFRVFGPKANE